ncbi:MAG TPA: hypothetical protein VF702_04190 [Allosphingosinicella sp.]|jgi:hypothetical protein
MILLKPGQIEDYVACVEAMGERADIVVTSERIKAFAGEEELH